VEFGGLLEGLLNTGREPHVTVEKFKMRFLTVVLGVWSVVVGASLYMYLAKGGSLPDPVLLGVPTGTWLAVFPPLPERLREEPAANA
jgi:hypothetical protein